MLLSDELSLLVSHNAELIEKFYKSNLTVQSSENLSNVDIATVLCVFLDDQLPNLAGEIQRVHDPYPEKPLVIVLSQSSEKRIHEFIDAGAQDFLAADFTLQDIQLLSSRLKGYNRRIYETKKLVRHLAASEEKLIEKNTVLHTILDILSHDTKNNFLKVEGLLDQLEDDPVRRMLLDAIAELKLSISEAVKYLDGGKRLFSLIDMLNSIKITKDHISVGNHPFLKLVYEYRYLLYTEASPILKNAIGNVIENALKYSQSSQPIEIHIEYSRTGFVLRVRDFGIGIAKKDREMIFQRSFRIRKTADVEGSGRGLWISRNIMQKEGGKLFVEDNPQGGADFIFTLPPYHIEDLDAAYERLGDWFNLPMSKIKDKARSVEAMLALQQIPVEYDFETAVYANLLDHLRKERKKMEKIHYKQKLLLLKRLNPEAKSVLIADDSVHVHHYLASYVTELGFRVAEYAKNGLEAYKFYASLKPDFITLDCTMPVMSGLEAASFIYKEDPDAKFIFITGLGTHTDFLKSVHEIMPNGTYSILTKPFRKEELSEVLARLT